MRVRRVAPVAIIPIAAGGGTRCHTAAAGCATRAVSTRTTRAKSRRPCAPLADLEADCHQRCHVSQFSAGLDDRPPGRGSGESLVEMFQHDRYVLHEVRVQQLLHSKHLRMYPGGARQPQLRLERRCRFRSRFQDWQEHPMLVSSQCDHRLTLFDGALNRWK